MSYSPLETYQASALLCRAGPEDARVNHLLGRRQVTLSPQAAAVLESFRVARRAGGLAAELGLGARAFSAIMRALRQADLLQAPGNDEAPRIRHAYRLRRRPPQAAFPQPWPAWPGLPRAEIALAGDAALAPGLMLLELDGDEVLVGRPGGSPVHLRRSAWDAIVACCAARAGGVPTDAGLLRAARLGHRLGLLIEAAAPAGPGLAPAPTTFDMA